MLKPADSPDLLSVHELSRRLGVSVRALRISIRRGQIPSMTIGRRRYLPRALISNWLAGIPVAGQAAGSNSASTMVIRPVASDLQAG
jgi:excisionase family DNA binding protein